MKIATIAILTIAPVLLAQDSSPEPAGPQIGARVVINQAQAGPLASPDVQFISTEMVGGNPVTGAPYSAQAITESTQTLADGNRIVHNTSSMLYRDSQGRERRELPLPNIVSANGARSPAHQMVMISDPVAGANYTLDATSRTARKMPMPQAVKRMAATAVSGANVTVQGESGGGMAIAAGILPPPPDGAGPFFFQSARVANPANLPKPQVEQLGTQTIQGVQALGTRTTTTIPAGQVGNDQDLNIVFERWYSPDLKMTVLSKRTDPRMGETDYSLTQINRSEPDPSLFQVPSDYTVIDTGMTRPMIIPKPQQ